MRVASRGLLLLMAVGVALAPTASVAAPDYVVGPPPTWVVPLIPAEDGAAPPQEGSDGVQFLLSDLQTRVTPKGPQHFLHFTRRIASEAGVESGAELRFDVNPAHERLTLHWVRVHRGGSVRDALSGAHIQVAQREEGLEARMFDGTRAVFVVLKDVRVGDVVDYAYSTAGQNPVFDGHSAHSITLGYDVPVEHLRYRLLWPRERTLHVKEHGGAVSATRRDVGAEHEWVWERSRVPAVKTEDSLPPDFDPYPWVQLSEWSSWHDVATWASRQFRRPARPSPGVAAQVRALARAHTTPTDRFLAALRFVQDEVRYLGFELGPNSHRPHSPEWVLARRFGDCKDKSLLLVALLEGLGIEAQPALVNTREQEGLDRWLPTPLAFDHVIVRARVEGRDVWVDPTRTLERGGLQGREPPAFGRALLISPDTRGLSPIPEATSAEPLMDVEESYEAKEEGGQATLEVVTRYRGSEADRMRRHTSSTPLAEVSRNALNFYARRDARIRSEGDATVEDDPARNVLTVTERYVIDGFWDEEGLRHFWAWPIEEQLASPQVPQRTQPLEVAHPVDVRYVVRLSLPRAPDVEPEHREVAGAAFRFHARARAEGRQLRLDYHFRSRARQLAPGQVAAHLEDQRKVRELLGYQLAFPTPKAASRSALSTVKAHPLSMLGFVLAAMGMMVVAMLPLLLVRRLTAGARQQTPVQALLVQPPPPRIAASPRAPEPGSAPAHALAVPDEAALHAHLAHQRCACGEGLGAVEQHVEGELLRMGERVITPVALHCSACGRERWLYFTVGPERSVS